MCAGSCSRPSVKREISLLDGHTDTLLKEGYPKPHRDRAGAVVHAKLTMRRSRSQRKSYDLRTFDVLENGVGTLVSGELFDWLKRIGIGDRLKGMELSAL